MAAAAQYKRLREAHTFGIPTAEAALSVVRAILIRCPAESLGRIPMKLSYGLWSLVRLNCIFIFMLHLFYRGFELSKVVMAGRMAMTGQRERPKEVCRIQSDDNVSE